MTDRLCEAQQDDDFEPGLGTGISASCLAESSDHTAILETVFFESVGTDSHETKVGSMFENGG